MIQENLAELFNTGIEHLFKRQLQDQSANVYNINITLLMLAQLPRKSLFPEHIINSIIARIESDVENDVIPVSAGIYSEYKLNEKLQAIPKPVVADYDDRVFFELADFERMPCKLSKCSSCNEEYGNKKHIPVQCKFCGVWSCSECICPRKRYHPRARESTSERYEICYKCDDKFLNLILNHSYVENRAILEEAIQRVRQQKHKIEIQCDKREQITTVTKDTVAKNKFKISGMKKDKINLNKTLTAMKKQKQDLLFKINIRQKYLAMLKNKKENQVQIIKNESPSKLQKMESMMDLSNQEKVIQQQSKPLKVARLMSQTAVVSQAIYQTKQVSQKSKQSHQKQQQKEKQLQKQEQIVLVEQPQNEIKVQNFFNFHEWGNQDAVVPDQDEKINNNEEQNFKRSPEESTIFDSNLPSPKSNLLSESEQVQETLAQKRLAEIFSKPETTNVEMEQQLSEPESLDAEVIDIRKREIMRAAIQQSHMQRLSLQDDELPGGSEMKKCACNIY